jgi:hypothetical protein
MRWVGRWERVRQREWREVVEHCHRRRDATNGQQALEAHKQRCHVVRNGRSDTQFEHTWLGGRPETEKLPVEIRRCIRCCCPTAISAGELPCHDGERAHIVGINSLQRKKLVLRCGGVVSKHRDERLTILA